MTPKSFKGLKTRGERRKFLFLFINILTSFVLASTLVPHRLRQYSEHSWYGFEVFGHFPVEI